MSLRLEMGRGRGKALDGNELGRLAVSKKSETSSLLDLFQRVVRRVELVEPRCKNEEIVQ